ncbi:MAG: hypothetical protein ABIH59_02375 [archaeon]
MVLQKKLTYTLLAFGLLVIIAVGITAYGGTQPSVMGHSIGELEPPAACGTGYYLQWDGIDWVCTASSPGSLWSVSGANIYRLSGYVGIGTSSPSAKLDIQGGNIHLIDSESYPYFLFGDSNGPETSGWLGWDSFENGISLAILTKDPSIHIDKKGNVGINTTNPTEPLDVAGNIHAESILADNSVTSSVVDASNARFQTASINTLTADAGLTLDINSFTMKATNGDNCVVEIISNRPAPSNFNIICYAPGTCGDFEVNIPAEECDPSGTNAYAYDVIDPVYPLTPRWDCSGSLMGDFDKVELGCTGCQFTTPPSICKCTTRCFDSHTYYNIHYDCDTYSNLIDACNANPYKGV